MIASEMRKKSVPELHEELLAYSKELFNLRMQSGLTENSVKPHLYKIVKKNIARVKTIIHEKEGANE